MASVSIGAYLGVVLVVLFLMCVFIVVFYAEPGFPWHSYITLTLGYYAAFGILLLVPVDIAAVVYDRRLTETGSYYYDIDTLGFFYDSFFTMVLVLGSVVLIFEEYYNTDGYFTWGGRISSSFKRMCLDNAGPLVVGVIILGILLGQHVVPSNADALKLTAVIITNTCYELGLMFLLGYSLVEFPRSIWLESNIEAYLLQIQMRAAAQFKAISDAQLSVSLVVSDVLKTKSSLSSYTDPLLAQALDVLVQECPPEFRSDRMGKVAADKKGQVTIDTLASLRTRLNTLKDMYRMSQAKVEGTKLLAYNLEDMVSAKKKFQGAEAPGGPRVIHWSLLDKDGTEFEYNWLLVYRPLCLKFAAIICMTLSVLSFLGVICSMTGVSNNVSAYYLAVHNDNVKPAGIVVFILITLGYTVYITTWSIFQVKVSAGKELVPSRSTPEALSFNVRMVARLAAPLAFFYLGWISENGLRSGDFTQNSAPSVYNMTTFTNVTSGVTTSITTLITGPVDMPSAFSNFYALQNIDAVQKIFGTIFPIILFIVLGLCLFNIFNRLLVLVKLDNYQFGAEIVTEEQLREGKRQLERHKKNTERAYRRGDLRSFIMRAVTAPPVVDGDGSPGFFASLFGSFGSKKGGKNARDLLNMAGEEPTIKEPAALKGTCERKGAFKLGGAQWKEVYAEVRTPGFLYVFKDKRTADSTPAQHTLSGALGNPPQSQDLTILDLRLVLDFTVPEKKNKDHVELDVETVDDTIKLKFKTEEEVEIWRKGLLDWKDHCVDYCTMFAGTGAKGDVEQGPGIAMGARGSNDGLLRASGSSTASGVHTTTTSPFNLDDIQVDEGSDEEDKGGFLNSGGGGSRGSLGGLFGMGKKKAAPSAHAPVFVHDGRPKVLEGWLDKKGHAKMGMGDSWQKRYIKISETDHALVYAKSSDPTEKPAGAIDLQLVRDVTVYEKAGKQDWTRFNIDLGDKVYKFRAANDTEGKRWVDGLNEWRDYFLLNM